MVVPHEPRVVGEVCDEVGGVDRDEGPCDGEGAEVPLLVDDGEGFEESEDEGVGETGEEGQAEDDGFGDKHTP